jgi:hypothetical protein
MNTTSFEISDNHNLTTAQSYYNAMLMKDFDKMANYLCENVHFLSPLAEMHGKDSVVLAAKNLSEMLQDIQIRSRFASQNQIMFAYDFIFPHPIGKLRASVLMEFTDNCISKIELFYDGRPFEKKGDEIFREQ